MNFEEIFDRGVRGPGYTARARDRARHRAHAGLLSSVGQSNALVMRRSSVRIRQGAPWKTPGQVSDLGFLVLGDLGIRADRASLGYASQCVGQGLTASGRLLWQGYVLAFLLHAAGRLGSVGFGVVAMRWPSVQRLCGWSPICRAVASELGAARLWRPDNPEINALRTG